MAMSSSPLFSIRSNTQGKLDLIARNVAATAFGLMVLFILGGCETTTPPPGEPAAVTQTGTAADPEMLSLREGDVVKVTFPGVPNMDTQQTVRQDGRITLPIIGDYVVLGKTTDALSKELREQYDSQLLSKEVNVTLVSSSFTLYVTGAVLRPGKIVTDRKLTAFEAIMEAGGFDKTKANLKAVVVVRQENGQSRRYTVNLEDVMSGKDPTPFYLKPFDSVYVPEKFTWF